MKKISTLILCFLFIAHLKAQDTCGINLVQQLLYQQDSFNANKAMQGFRQNINYWRNSHAQDVYESRPNSLDTNYNLVNGSCRKVKYVLPVLVHIVHDGSPIGTGCNISDAQVHHALEVLNDAFANSNSNVGGVNTQIQFCLPTKNQYGTATTGISRTSSILTNHNIDKDIAALFNTLNGDRERYIHIYIVKSIVDSNGVSKGISGYGTYPQFAGPLKGIVLKFDKMGDYTIFGAPLATHSRGKTLVHEMGHYLGVVHPFDGSCAGLDSTNCATEGDMCCDVPAVSQPYYTCIGMNTCTETYNNNPADQRENYMDYAPESCSNILTKDQRSIMHASLELYKSQMISVDNIYRTNPQCCVQTAQFEASRNVCTTDTIYCRAMPYTTAVTNIWDFYRNDSLIHSDTNAVDFFNLPPTGVVGTLDIKLSRIFNNNDTLVQILKNYTEVFDCTDTLRHPNANWYFGRFTEWIFGATQTYPRWGNGPNDAIGKPGFNTQINASEGTISQSDSMGRLLFYGGAEITNNFWGDTFIRIFDNSYREMAGSPIKGYFSNNKGNLSIKNPTDTNQYYIIHLNNSHAFSSLVDMSVISTTSNGAIIQKNDSLDPVNTPLFSSLSFAESITAIESCQPGVSFIYIPSSTDLVPFMYVYKLDSTGIQFQDTVRLAYISNNPDGAIDVSISPDGSLMAYENYLYHIDRRNGKLTLKQHLDNPFYASSSAWPREWGICFSPNSKLLYKYVNVPNLRNSMGVLIVPKIKEGLIQQDLQSQDMELSKKLIQEKSPIEQGQIGPDGRIYYANSRLRYASVINEPNKVMISNAAEIGFVHNGPKTGVGSQGGRFESGLPHLITALPAAKVEPDFRATIKGCDTVFFESSQCCANNIDWNFGDGTFGNGRFVSHKFASTDSITVTMNADGKQKTQTIYFPFYQNKVSIVGTGVLCDTFATGQATAKFNAAYEYLWTGNNISNVFLNNGVFYFNASIGATIYLNTLDTKTGCQSADTLNITFDSAQLINTIANDSIFCKSDTIKAIS